MVTFDVVGLFSHIPHKEGLETIKRYLDKREDQSVILKHNYFGLGQDVYQILGTAIGTKFAPHYANIFTAELEGKTLATQSFNHCFCLWADTTEKLKDFLDFLNAFHPSIKFTMEHSPYQINYLDVLITKDESGETVHASLYTKPTDSHHAVYKKSIPYSQAVRVKQICSEEENLQHKLGDLESL